MADVRCPSCAKRLRLPDSAAGKRVRCPGCQSAVPVPSAANGQAGAAAQGATERIAARCPHCRVTLRLPAGAAGKQVRCPKCKQGFTAKAGARPAEAARRREPAKAVAAAAPAPVAALNSPDVAAAAGEAAVGTLPLDDFPLTDTDFDLSRVGGNLPAAGRFSAAAAVGSSEQAAVNRAVYALPATLTVVVGSINLLGFLGLAILSLVLSLLTFNLVGVAATVIIGASAVMTGANTVLGGVNILRMIDRRHGIWAGRMLLVAPFFGLAFCAWRIDLILGLIVFVVVLFYSWPVGWWMMLLLERKKAITDFGELSDEELASKYR